MFFSGTQYNLFKFLWDTYRTSRFLQFRSLSNCVWWNARGQPYKTRLEFSKISHKVVFPYLYVKGDSGYTRVLLTPIGTDILKVPSYSFYDTASIIEDIDSINHLKRVYGNSISIKDDLNQISEADRIIFESL